MLRNIMPEKDKEEVNETMISWAIDHLILNEGLYEKEVEKTLTSHGADDRMFYDEAYE
jgi:hypothetical protein